MARAGKMPGLPMPLRSEARVTAERTDYTGREHPRCGPAPRIVSLVPSITELLFDLGLGPFVAGRTTFCIHPRPAVESVPRVGGTKTVRIDRLRRLEPTHVIVNVDENRRSDVEAIESFTPHVIVTHPLDPADNRLEPTHVIVNVDENRRSDVEAIESFTPHVIVTHPLDPADNPGLFRLIGSIFGRDEAAARLAGAFAEALAAVAETAGRLPARRVLYLIWKEPWMTVSRDTYISRTLALVNWETAAHDPGVRYPEVMLAEPLFAGIDLVLLSSEPYPFKPEHAALVRAAPGGARVPIALIDAEMISWYGSRAIPGLRYLARFAECCTLSPSPLSLIIR